MSVRERLEQMKEAANAVDGRNKPSRVVYCTKCDEYVAGRNNLLSCDFLDGGSDIDHTEHHVIGDYEETSLHGYIRALEWVNDRNVDTETRPGGEQ